MSEEDIDAMTAEAIDVAVAEKVLGWKRGDGEYMSQGWLTHEVGPDRWCWAGWLSVEPRIVFGEGYHEHQEPMEIMGTARFSPSTDIAAAWEVASWLREHWGQFRLEAGLSWHCWDEIGGERRHWGTGDTAPLAICRAALKACANTAPTPNG